MDMMRLHHFLDAAAASLATSQRSELHRSPVGMSIKLLIQRFDFAPGPSAGARGRAGGFR